MTQNPAPKNGRPGETAMSHQYQPSSCEGSDSYGHGASYAPGGAEPYGSHTGPQSYAHAAYAQAPQRNNLALFSLILSIVGLATGGLTAIGGIVLGHMAKEQIKRTGETGEDLATWGLILGYVVAGITVLALLFWILLMFVFVGGFALSH